ncbi:electron transfer flavoprotein, partial [Halobacterium salinarum]|nr:electron transfer flavoprotein [Halobacterium salinarum]
RAAETGDVSESMLWEYNEHVMDHFGARYAALDVYNIMSTAIDVDDLMGLLAALPGQKLAEALYDGSTQFGLKLKLVTALKSFGYWSEIMDFYRAKQQADRLLDHYRAYPSSPDGLADWQARRDDIMQSVYDVTGADAKY